MARHKASKSAIQADPVLFAKIREEIYDIGPIPLSTFGLVSRTTLHDYSKGLPVTGNTEQAILDSIELWQKEQKKQADARADKARGLVEA